MERRKIGILSLSVLPTLLCIPTWGGGGGECWPFLQQLEIILCNKKWFHSLLHTYGTAVNNHEIKRNHYKDRPGQLKIQ